MPFLIFFGALLIVYAITAKFLFKIKLEPDENTCNMKQELKEVKQNKIMFYIYLYGGSALTIIGIVGTCLF